MAINHGSLSANLTPRGVVGGRVQNSVLAYENDYENLINKPSINDTELNGDLSLEDLGIVNNVQPDWEQTDTEAGDYINNKPDIPENLSDLNDDADHRTVSDTEKITWNNKSDFSGSYNDLTDKPVIPDAQIQSDWNQNDNTKADYIKNKPSIPSAQVQSDWNESDSSKADFIKNKPTIPAEQVNSDWNAESGKAQILNKPSIPTALADLTDDSTHRTVTDTEKTAWNSGEANVQSNWNETDTTSDAYIQNKPSIPSVTANPGSTTATLSSIGIDGINYAISGGSGGGAVNSVNGKTGDVTLGASDVGALPDDTPLFSGDYEDLTNKPTIPDDLADLNDDSTHRLVTDTEKTTWNGKSDFSGSYNDLSNKPTLGTASALDVPASGNASTSQVVKGDDTRLTDARPASDVSSWAKASTKPDYTASEVGAIATTAKGTANGVAELDENGKVPSAQLPSYVDDVLEYASVSVFPATGESGKIYIALDTNKTYRWSGTTYTEISESLALGETDSTAYAGNKGKQNADNIAALQDLIPSSATTSNKLATASDIPDISGKADKSEMSVSTSGDQTTIQLKNGTSATVLNAHQSITGKADKVTNATENNFAALDANGNLKDSGHKHSDYLTQHQDISSKADKVISATADNLATLNANGNLVDSGIGKDKIILLSDRTPRDITNDLSRLTTAVSEQNLEKYGYKIGDYFMGTSQPSNNFRYWLADMDTFYGGYDHYAVESVHHIGIVVDTMQSSQWYTSSDITDVGYNQSTLHSYLSGSALDIIKADMIALFGGSTGLEHLLGHTKLWNKLGTWYWSDENTYSQYIAALTEAQLTGTRLWSADNYQQGEGHKQLNLFAKYCFNQIFGWTWIWLRSIASSGDAVLAHGYGCVDDHDVTYSFRAAGLILFH